MGKKRKTGKKEGVFLTILVLFCTFLTGCAFLDIRDGGQGPIQTMWNRKKNQPQAAIQNPRTRECPKKKLRLPGLPRRGKHH